MVKRALSLEPFILRETKRSDEVDGEVGRLGEWFVRDLLVTVC